jgi:hypothetical protein
MKSRKAGVVALMLALVVSSFSMAASAQEHKVSGEEVLTNEKIVTMTRAGLSATLIVNKIRSSKTNFNVSTDELIRLKQAKVSDDIINAMVEASSSASASISRTGAGDVARTDANDPLSAHEAGIYLIEEKDGQKRMTELEPSISSQSKSGGFFTSAMTGGLTKIKSKAVLASPNARLQISNPRPVFYFYFEVKSSGLSNSGNVYASSSTSPNEFVLVEMDGKKNGRELVVGQFNAFGAQSGTLDKYARAFDYEKIAPGVYKVTPRVDLTGGEYGFFYGGSTPLAGYGYFGAGVSPKIFDFGIKLAR